MLGVGIGDLFFYNVIDVRIISTLVSAVDGLPVMAPFLHKGAFRELFRGMDDCLVLIHRDNK